MKEEKGDHFYDVMIDINSSNFKKEDKRIPFQVSLGSYERFFANKDKGDNKVSKKICLVGRQNTGKTHMLNTLIDTKYAEGNSYHTKGISFKFPDSDEHNCFIDLEGLNKPSFNLKDQKTTDKKEDIKYVQDMILSYIQRQCDAIIMVVNHLNFYQQDLLRKLRDKQKDYRSTTILVVHNYMSLDNKQIVESHVRDNVLKSFKLS